MGSERHRDGIYQASLGANVCPALFDLRLVRVRTTMPPDAPNKLNENEGSEIADGSNYRVTDDPGSDVADGSNYRDEDADSSEIADGSNYQVQDEPGDTIADGSNYRDKA